MNMNDTIREEIDCLAEDECAACAEHLLPFGTESASGQARMYSKMLMACPLRLLKQLQLLADGRSPDLHLLTRLWN